MAKKIVDKNIIDLDLSSIQKKRFRIDGDDSRILELNTSDMGILGRLKDSEGKIAELTSNAVKNWPDDIVENVTDSDIDSAIKVFNDADKGMKEIIDYIFDAPVSKICVPNGTMFDPINGEFRYEHIIEALGKLYEANITTEIDNVSTRIKKHTAKYTN